MIAGLGGDEQGGRPAAAAGIHADEVAAAERERLRRLPPPSVNGAAAGLQNTG